MIELLTAMMINLVVAMAVGALLVGGNRTWERTYNSANKKMRQDALATTVAFGSAGRKANRLSYTIYDVSGSTFTPAVAKTTGEEVVSGDAVEFRYWDVALDETDSHNLMNVSRPATAYALFYIEDNTLKLDHGPYPPGAVADGGGFRNVSGVTTTVLAENAYADSDSAIGLFSHTTFNGVGQGSVRTNIVLKDPDDDESVKVMTATLMRNIWPR
jgi:hypothetical protein